MKFGQAIGKFFENWKLGALAGTVAYGLSYMITWLNIPLLNYQGKYISATASVVDINLRQQAVTQGGLNAVGQQVLTTLTGFASKIPIVNQMPPIDWGAMLSIIIGAIIAVGLGSVLFNWLNAERVFRFANKINLDSRTLGTLFLGSFALYIILAVMSAGLSAFTFGLAILAIPMLIYFAIVTLIISFLGQFKVVQRIFK